MTEQIVSVAIITYNQQEYIAKALDSVLAQRGDFRLQIVVGDDASTDQTSQICADYATRFPDRVWHVKRPSNLGYVRNLVDVLGKCSGRYIALLEADDHWVSETKVAEQLSALEKHPSCILCFTNSAIDDTRVPELKQYFTRDNDIVFTYEDCLSHCVAPTSTFLFKKDGFTPPEWFTSLATYEYFLIYLIAAKGDIYYLNRITACRTQHYRGQSTTSIDRTQALISNTANLNNVAPTYTAEKRAIVKSLVLRQQIATARNCLRHQDVAAASQVYASIHLMNLTPDARGLANAVAFSKLFLKLRLATTRKSFERPPAVNRA